MAKKKVEEAVEIQDPEKEVSVEIDDNNNVVKPEVKKAEEPRYVKPEELQETLRKSNAAFFAEQRKIQATLERLESSLKPKETPREVPIDEWDLKVQKNWKGTVEELADARAEAKYRQMREKEISEQKLQEEQTRTLTLLDNNKRTVMQRHPELEDPTSDKSRTFQDVISRNPDYLTNPFGPVLAMRDMEEELRSQGKMDEPVRKMVENEVQRRARTSATVVPNGNGNGQVNKIILTKDEKQYCDDHKIKYESFAATKHKLSTQREIEA